MEIIKGLFRIWLWTIFFGIVAYVLIYGTPTTCTTDFTGDPHCWYQRP